jgi:hypothetical protein
MGPTRVIKHNDLQSTLALWLKVFTLAPIWAYFMDSSRHYLMLEHINGQDTRQLVRQNGAQKESTVIRWAMEIAATQGALR